MFLLARGVVITGGGVTLAVTPAHEDVGAEDEAGEDTANGGDEAVVAGDLTYAASAPRSPFRSTSF